jgi:hypothetical protein
MDFQAQMMLILNEIFLKLSTALVDNKSLDSKSVTRKNSEPGIL